MESVRRPKTAWQYYLINLKKQKLFTTAKEVALMWKNLDEESKSHYHKLADADYERYYKILEERGIIFRRRKKKKIKDPNQKIPAIFNFYRQYAKKYSMKHNVPYKQAISKLSKKWRKMTPEKKKKYEDKRFLK